MAHPDSAALVGMLPHRPPFRFVDVVDEISFAEHIEARWRITGEEAFLLGHFPGNPIVPGVLQLEALAQAGALTLLGDERYAGQAGVVRRGREGALPASRAPRRRAAARGRRRAVELARGLGAGAGIGRGRHDV